MALYSEKVMDHFRNPRNVGVIEDADGVGEVGNPKCGDIMKMYLKIEDETIKDVKFETFGCGSAIASSSMATELIKGKPLSEAMELTNKAVAEALDGLPAYKMHCSVLAEEAIKAAVQDYYEKHGIEMGFENAQLYEESANLVIHHPDVLHKTEKEDGDTCFYLEETNEFVVLSTDGYIRTYFWPDSGKKYYDKQ